MKARLVRDYVTKYPDPIAFQAGEPVLVGARDTEWPGFLWCTDARGRVGWVHERYLGGDAGTVSAVRDYDARELDARAGDIVELVEEAGGWWWSVDNNGRRGWLPVRDLDVQQEQT